MGGYTLELMWIAFGLVGAAYFIGEGLKNFRHPNENSLTSIFEENDDHELINEKDLHHFIGTSKDDAKALLKEYPNVPHFKLNGSIYFPKKQLREWLLKIGK